MQESNSSPATAAHLAKTRTLSHQPAFDRKHVGELLGSWRARELAIAKGSFRECRGLALEQLEDLYQKTTVALLVRPYRSEEHLRNALRFGLKKRALNLHRDERGHREKLQSNAPLLVAESDSRELQSAPESNALRREDQLLVAEFLSELTGAEQSVFWLIAEGMRYRAIAPALGIPVNEARKLARSCERKRERFQLLYSTGRLCGFRSGTIRALQAGECESADLARRAFAHIERCPACRAEHKTNAQRLMRSFNEQATALLPLPVLVHHRLASRIAWWVRNLQGRLLGLTDSAQRLSLPGSGSAVAKVAVAGVVAIGGGVSATHALGHPSTKRHAQTSERASSASSPSGVAGAAPYLGVISPSKSFGHSRGAPSRRAAARHLSRARTAARSRVPATAGLDYLGVAAKAAASNPPSGSSGGPFSP